jgi:hypothetical protein
MVYAVDLRRSVILFQEKNRKMRKFLGAFAILLAVCVFEATAQATSISETDRAAIKQTALDYAEGWYEANPERMERALHPDLSKRIVRTGPQGQAMLQQMSAMGLVQGVKRGGGKDTPKEQQQKDVTILDVFENAASVKVVMSGWVDYLHMARVSGRWVIVNVLWELKPPKK